MKTDSALAVLRYEGALARRNRLPKDANPYDPCGSQAHQVAYQNWAWGWRDAHVKLKIEQEGRPIHFNSRSSKLW